MIDSLKMSARDVLFFHPHVSHDMFDIFVVGQDNTFLWTCLANPMFDWPDVLPHPVIQQSGLPMKLLVPRARPMTSALLEVTSPESSSRAMSLGNPAPFPL
mgnify:CR=1 FL=1